MLLSSFIILILTIYSIKLYLDLHLKAYSINQFIIEIKLLEINFAFLQDLILFVIIMVFIYLQPLPIIDLLIHFMLQ